MFFSSAAAHPVLGWWQRWRLGSVAEWSILDNSKCDGTRDEGIASKEDSLIIFLSEPIQATAATVSRVPMSSMNCYRTYLYLANEVAEVKIGVRYCVCTVRVNSKARFPLPELTAGVNGPS